MILPMDVASTLLVWSVNLLVGAGLLVLGAAMLRRPERLWIGFRVPRDPEEAARIRRANRRTAPPFLLLGALDVLSGPIALVAGIPPLMLALWGLAILFLAIANLTMAAALAR